MPLDIKMLRVMVELYGSESWIVRVAIGKLFRHLREDGLLPHWQLLGEFTEEEIEAMTTKTLVRRR